MCAANGEAVARYMSNQQEQGQAFNQSAQVKYRESWEVLSSEVFMVRCDIVTSDVWF